MPDTDPLEVLDRFGAAFNGQDLDATLALMTDDCAFESTSPPDGVRAEGKDAVRAAFGEFFASSIGARFDTEEQFVAGDRAIVRWRYTWPAADGGAEGHIRGIDVFRIRDGLVAEKCSYVKG
jgi:ketosteroid isomerase-like protein